jgi:hypothetical protein
LAYAMTRQENHDDQTPLEKLIALLLRLPWPDVRLEVGRAMVKALRSWSIVGMYEALGYEPHRRCHDTKERAASASPDVRRPDARSL